MVNKKLKLCTECNEVKDIDEFYKNKGSCKKCYNALTSEIKRKKKYEKNKNKNISAEDRMKDLVPIIEKLTKNVNNIEIMINDNIGPLIYTKSLPEETVVQGMLNYCNNVIKSQEGLENTLRSVKDTKNEIFKVMNIVKEQINNIDSNNAINEPEDEFNVINEACSEEADPICPIEEVKEDIIAQNTDTITVRKRGRPKK